MDEPQQQFQAELDLLRGKLHRGRLGLLVGAVVGVLASVTLGIVLGSDGASVWDVSISVTFGCFGAAIGHLITVGRLGGRADDVVGFDIAADRIKRAVRGEDHSELTPEQQQRAARYAALIVLVSPAQALRWTLFVIGLFIGQLTRLIESALEAGPPFGTLVPAAIGVFGAVVLAGFIPAGLRAARRARAYSQTHPWQARHPHTTGGTEHP